ncbi:kinase [Gardnerella pickettii]|uniref:kinase n=1 Tax=Gardnerella pickettii TaxID=2914924 RepID=UPI0039F11530|nr:kinase [Bifidobacterium sp. UMB6791B]MDK8248756.1 kinase [Bifidobacterium sp. UMB6794B]MDK8635067.1 kinase [Bifidobacterium sp. UMB6791A]
MKPQLGDIILNRYALISPLREEAGIQVWKASDRILARDCQLFIVRDRRFLPEVNTISSTLALSRIRKFTPVLKIHNIDDVAIIITELDSGITVDDYIKSHSSTLSYEAIRSIVAEAANALSKLLASGITHYAISTNTVRITNNGVELACAPISPLLKDVTVEYSKQDSQKNKQDKPNTKNKQDAQDSQNESENQNKNEEPSNNLPQSVENIATHQLSALLYALLTRTGYTQNNTVFNVSRLADGVPGEFVMICKRGLSSAKDSSIIPMASIGELLALLGTYTPVKKLSEKDIILNNNASESSIQKALLLPCKDEDLIDFPEGLSKNEDLLENQLSSQESIGILDSSDLSIKNEDEKPNKFGKNAKNTGLKNASKTIGALSALLKRNGDNSEKKLDSLPESDSTGTDYDFHDIAAAEMANILAPTELDADDSIFHNLSSTYTSFPGYSTDKSQASEENKVGENKNNKNNENSKNTNIGNDSTNDSYAKENGNKSALNALDSLTSGNDYSQKDDLSSPLMPRRFDFEDLLSSNTRHTELLSKPQILPLEAESTGRVPVVDSNGRFVAPGEESARALREEELENEEYGDYSSQNTGLLSHSSMPPSFQPHEHQDDLKAKKSSGQNNVDIADAKIFGGLSTKVLAIGVVALLVIVVFAISLHSLFNSHEAPSNFAKSNSWDSQSVENVPFGSQGVLSEDKSDSSKEKQPNKPGTSESDANKAGEKNKSNKDNKSLKNKHKKQNKRKKVKQVPKPKMPTNNTPYPIDIQQFLEDTGNQRGYGYYMHLTQPQEAYRFVVSIRSSGGHGYLIANSKNDPSAGEKVADFTFDASGVTDVKFKKPITAQDFILWVPQGSIPMNGLYINYVRIY